MDDETKLIVFAEAAAIAHEITERIARGEGSEIQRREQLGALAAGEEIVAALRARSHPKFCYQGLLLAELKEARAVIVNIQNALANRYRKSCYQCDAPVAYLFDDGRCSKCTREMPEEGG